MVRVGSIAGLAMLAGALVAPADAQRRRPAQYDATIRSMPPRGRMVPRFVIEDFIARGLAAPPKGYPAESRFESHASAGAAYPPLPAGGSHGHAWGGRSAPPMGGSPSAAPMPGVYAGGYSPYAYSAGGSALR